MGILGHVARRLLQAIPLLLGISLISFFLINLAPGDFLSKYRADPRFTDEFIHDLEVQYGLTDAETGEPTGPAVQYLIWLRNIVLHSDFGYSFENRQPVWSILWARTLNTLWLSGNAILLALVFALPLGVYSAARQYRWQDTVCSLAAFTGLSLPNVFLALLVVLFAARTGLLPTGKMRAIVGFEDLSPLGKIGDLLHHVIGPALVLGTAAMASYMRQMRGNLLDVLESDYVRTARAKGLGEATVVGKHGVRNAINPVITLLGFSISDLLSGSILVENVMDWPGLGSTVVEALFNRDLYLVMASVVMASVMLIVGNLIADLMLAWSDPRIRLR